MDLITDMIHRGGPFMWPILLLLGLTPLWTIVLAGLGVARFRVPAFLWWSPALLVSIIGALGTVIGQHQAIEAVAHASAETQGTLAAAGHSVALVTRVAGNFAGSAILFGTVLCAALAAVARPGEVPRNSIGSAVGAGFLAGCGGLVLAVVAWVADAGVAGMVIGLTFASLVAFSLLVGGVRTSPIEEDANRVAELRLVMVGGLVGAVVLGGYGIVDHGASVAHEAIAHASAETMLTLQAMGASISGGGWVVMGLGLAITLVASSISVRASSGRMLDGRAVISVVMTLFGIVVWLGLLATFSSRAVGYKQMMGV